jgi:hypothetical protein
MFIRVIIKMIFFQTACCRSKASSPSSTCRPAAAEGIATASGSQPEESCPVTSATTKTATGETSAASEFHGLLFEKVHFLLFQPVAQQPKAQPSVPAAAKASAQPAAQQPKAAAQVPAATAATTQQRQPPPVAREPEQLEAPKSVLRHAQFQPRNPKAESHEWPPREEEEADQLAQSQPVPQNKVLVSQSPGRVKRIQRKEFDRQEPLAFLDTTGLWTIAGHLLP